MKFRLLAAAALPFLVLQTGCIRRSITKPRSEIVTEAAKGGQVLRSNEEESKRFYAHEQAQRDRLVQLLKGRSSNGELERDYRIGPGDAVELNVFDVPELNLTAKVKESGFISLPLLGAVQAAGLTEIQLRDQLTARLRKYVHDPQASVFITEYGSQKIGVLGAVAKPGTYPLKKGANSVIELISEAGGVSDKAGNVVNFIPGELSGIAGGSDAAKRAQITLAALQSPDIRNRAIEIYLDQLLGAGGGVPLEIPVRGGDMIIIPEAGTVNVEGEVEKRGNVQLGKRMSLLGALATAGGITYSANINEIEVIRELTPGDKVHLVVNLEHIMRGDQQDTRLRDGDIIRVPSNPGRRLSEDTFRTVTQFINFGVSGGMSIAP